MTQLKFLFRLYQSFHGLSLDVALGVALLSSALAKVFQQSFSKPFLICLVGGVWLIYNLDHKWDISRLKEDKNTQTIRYNFHRQHQKLIWILSLVLSLYMMVLFLSFNLEEILFSGFMVFLMFCYFYTKYLQLKTISIEIMMSFIYVLGTFSLSWLGFKWDFPLIGYCCMVCVFLLVHLNLLVIQLYEVKMDLRNNDLSSVIRKGYTKTRLICYCNVFLVFIFSVFISLLNFDFLALSFIFIMMSFLCLFVLWFSNFLKIKERYRILIETMFYLPFLVFV